MAQPGEWIEALRPRTLPASLAPVFVGTGAAASLDAARPARAVLAGIVALALQIGVNFANDYSDGVRGTDEDRRGPQRLVASGAASPRAVKLAAFGAFGVAMLAGLALVALTGHWWLLAVGALAIVAAWYYTGGKHPYGYAGLGDVAVFVFFGLMAVAGTCFTQADRVPLVGWLGAAAMGLLACALLMANNVRDVTGDEAAGKHTLAVRLGQRRARACFTAELAAAIALGLACGLVRPWAALFVLPAAVWAIALARREWRAATVREHIGVLQSTGLLELAFGVLLAVGIAL